MGDSSGKPPALGKMGGGVNGLGTTASTTGGFGLADEFEVVGDDLADDLNDVATDTRDGLDSVRTGFNDEEEDDDDENMLEEMEDKQLLSRISAMETETHLLKEQVLPRTRIFS